MKIIYVYTLFFILAIYDLSIPQGHSSVIKYLTNNSDIIITGKVVHRQSEWINNNTKIVTNVTILPEEYLKGTRIGNNITVTCPGGEVGDTGELYSHMPVFSPDENVLLFLKQEKNNYNFIVVNGQEGKITLFDEPGTGDKITPASVKLSALKEEIRSLLEDNK